MRLSYFTTRLAINRLPVRSPIYIRFRGQRVFADSRLPPTRYEPDAGNDYETSPQNVQNQFIEHTTFAFRNLGRVLAYVGYGTLVLGLVTVTAFEGGHYWIERQMRSGSDEDAERWGWEAEGWTGGNEGGTSPALGFYGRHAVRAAWFALHYGSPFGDAVTISQTAGGGGGSLNVVPSDLESARLYLEAGLGCVRDSEGNVPVNRVGLDLLERHAAVLERIGTRAALARAREEYIQILDGLAGQRLSQARFAVKLGDISERLADDEAAIVWWCRGIELITDDVKLDSSAPARVWGNSTSALQKQMLELLSQNGVSRDETGSVAHVFPVEPPSIPAAQRTLVAALLSLSAYFSRRTLLAEAKQIQEYGISLIDAMTPTDASSTTDALRKPHSPGQVLHQMYLLQRKSILRVHRAESRYALVPGAEASNNSLMDLLTAASLSEVVVQILTGTLQLPSELPSKLSSESSSAFVPRISPHFSAKNAPLTKSYRESLWLRASARSLLRDACLTAVEAWDLCGVLYGQTEDGAAKALKCFERAWGWTGEPAASNKGVSGRRWESLWERYNEARTRMELNKAQGAGLLLPKKV